MTLPFGASSVSTISGHPHLAAENSLDAYQSPFQAPLYSIPSISSDFSSILTILFFLTFMVWAVYTAIATYHWIRYGHRSWLAIPLISVHIAISVVLILLMASGVQS